MATLIDKIYEKALDLPTDDRLKLVDKLLHSTNLPIDRDIDTAWSDEVEKRTKELENGVSKLIVGETVLANARKRFSK